MNFIDHIVKYYIITITEEYYMCSLQPKQKLGPQKSYSKPMEKTRASNANTYFRMGREYYLTHATSKNNKHHKRPTLD